MSHFRGLSIAERADVIKNYRRAQPTMRYYDMEEDFNKGVESYAGGGPIKERFMQPTDSKLPTVQNPDGSRSSEGASSIGGEGGEPAYLVPTLKYGQNLMWPNNAVQEFRNTGEHVGGPFKTWQEAETWERNVRHPYVEKGESIPSPLRFKSYANGGAINTEVIREEFGPKSLTYGGAGLALSTPVSNKSL